MSATQRSLVLATLLGRRWCHVVAALGCLAACGNEAVSVSARQRQGRLGSLRDLVLFDRLGQALAQALFVDRFEVTRADWIEFADTDPGRTVGADLIAVDGDLACPVAGVNLRQARAFARWRCLRLPSREEWDLVTTGDGHSVYPWGDREDPSRANTGELGILSATPVGTFESGRRAGGNQPYDLIGNVSEWTESVPVRWFVDELNSIAGLSGLRNGLLRCRSVSVWGGSGGVFPSAWLVQIGGDRVPRDVVGADFQSPMTPNHKLSADPLVEAVPAGDRRQRTGLRLYGTAMDFIAAACELPGRPTAAEMEQLRDFVLRDGHRERLRAAYLQTAPKQATAFARLLAQELGIAVESSK